MFIRQAELEFLLSNYGNLLALLEELGIQAKTVKAEAPGSDADLFSKMVRRNTDGMPFATGRVSDKTFAAVLDRYSYSREIKKEIRQIQDEMLLIEQVLQVLELGLRRLSTRCRQVIKLKFTQGLSWREVVLELNITERTARGMARAGMNKLLDVCKIDMIDYQKLKSFMEGWK